MTTRSRHLLSLAVLSLAFVGAAGASAHTVAKAPTWVTTKGKVVNLTIIAAYAGGFDFNGYGQGKMTITIPAGDTVNVTFSNNAPLGHSAQIIAAFKTPPVAPMADAFKGANSPNMMQGITKGTTQKFSFVAAKPGTYALICAVPGHAAGGMWDKVVVSAKAKTASISIAK